MISPDHADGAEFAAQFYCKNKALGTGDLPELDWSGVPAGTLSFAITFIDTTASGELGQHWAAWDIPASVMMLPKALGKMLTGDLMGAKQTNAYLAPCPTADDKYEFRLYALDKATLSQTDLTGVTAGTGLANTGSVRKLNTLLETGPTLGKAVLNGICKKQM
jgi:Raf kinase inhibitor-like YbhB/YbcL family protein